MKEIDEIFSKLLKLILFNCLGGFMLPLLLINHLY